MLKRLVVGTVLVLGLAAAPAHAAVLFFDNFNSEHGGVGALNYSAFQNFTISNGTVDLIGNGFFEFPPVTNGHGLYVDLDGSTGDAGVALANPLSLMAGNYSLGFQLAGNQRGGAADVVNINVFLDGNPFFAGAILKPANEPFLFYDIPLTLATGGNLTFAFSNLGGDNIGALLDNVSLEGPAQVPEPASLLLFGTAAMLRLVRRRA